MTEIRNSVFAGIAFGTVFAFFLAIPLDLEEALIVGSIAGLIFGGALYFFVTSKLFNRQTQIDLNGQTVIRSGAANHFMNGEAVGGKLYLLDDKLIFKSHGLNIQDHEQEILLVNIVSIEFCNTLGLVPNGIEILQTDNQSDKFVLNHRKLWRTEIDRLKNN